MIELFEKLDRKQLIDLFNRFLLKSNFSIKKEEFTNDPIYIEIDDGIRKIYLYLILKNIGAGGWKELSDIKRIQIGCIKNYLQYTTKNKTFLLCGITNVNQKNILVVWNAYRYLSHKTNRSCYINNDDLEIASKKGYYFINNYEQEIWLCDEEHFGLLIRDYISYNYMVTVNDN